VRPWLHDPFVVARPTALGPRHALASAAIPFIFPAPRIDGGYFCDGGLRLNTPLAPALRLGADRLLIIGLRHPPTPEEEAALSPHRESNYTSLAYLGGKVLNALLLDHVDYDVDRLRLVNAILDTGVRAYGLCGRLTPTRQPAVGSINAVVGAGAENDPSRPRRAGSDKAVPSTTPACPGYPLNQS
jgi:hypothetical protein